MLHCSFHVVTCIVGNSNQQHPLHPLQVVGLAILSSWQQHVWAAFVAAAEQQVSVLLLWQL
jgi:hypothetical protein